MSSKIERRFLYIVRNSCGIVDIVYEMCYKYRMVLFKLHNL